MPHRTTSLPIWTETQERTLFFREGEVDAHIRAGASGSALRWYVAVAEPRDYNNVTTCGMKMRPGCAAPITYRYIELPHHRGSTDLDTEHVSELQKAGTHRVLSLRDSDEFPADTASLLATSIELVVRRDDSYVGHLTELIGVPFVFLPRKLPELGHQTDARIGADCAALVIYGRRRMGEPVPYVAPQGLVHFTEVVSQEDGDRQPVIAGDILHFGYQTAVLSQDLEPLGFLSENDLVIHTYHGLAEETAVASLPYRNSPMQVRRWPARAGSGLAAPARRE